MMRFVKSNAMQCLLKVDLFVVIPNRRASWITALANNQIALGNSVFCFFFRQEAHLKHVGKIKVEPADVQISKIWSWFSLVLCFIEHLAQRMRGNFTDPLVLPHRIHRSALILFSIAALSASSAAISAIIAWGLR